MGEITKHGISVFERSDVQEPALSVDIDGQRGRVNLVPYSKRDTPTICCEIEGEHGSSVSINEIIDDWEGDDLAEYYVPASSGYAYTTPDRTSDDVDLSPLLARE